jgi:integrase
MPSIKFYLNRPKRNGQLRTDEVSIFAIFTQDRTHRFPIWPEEKIVPKYWDFKSQTAKNNYRHQIDLNNALSDFKQKLLNLWRENRKLTFAEFKKLALEKENPSQKKTIIDTFGQLLNQHENESDIKTFQKYRQLKELLETFSKKRVFDFPTLDLSFYDDFKAFLFSQPNRQYKNFRLVKDGSHYIIEPGKGLPVPLLDNTVYKLISNLTTFLGWAEDRGHTVHPSYKKWNIIQHTPQPISLTKEELNKLESAILPENLAIARDYLVFECRTGQRISDIKRFSLADFHEDRWTFSPKKGNKLNMKRVTVHFDGYCAPALEILKRHNFQMPAMAEQKINKYIKDACKVAGIDTPTVRPAYSGAKLIKMIGAKYEFCSSHVGRKTFITLALQHQMSHQTVMDLTGITNLKTLQHYYSGSEAGIVKQQLKDMDSKMRSA